MTPGPGLYNDSRLRYAYRRLVMDGKVRLSLEAARRLVGPDCAYHLYALLGPCGMVRGRNGRSVRTVPRKERAQR